MIATFKIISNFIKKNQPSKRVILVRKVTREIVGATFWVHALYVSRLIPLPNVPSPSIWLLIFNLSLLGFIANYTFLSNWGWLSVCFDLGYIYFLPFIYAVRIIWVCTKLFFRVVRKSVTFKSPSLIITASEQQPQAQSAELKVSNQAESNESAPNTSRSLWSYFRRMFSDFAILWSVFVFTLDPYSPFLAVAVAMTLLGAFGAFRTMWGLFSGTPSWFLKTESLFTKVINVHIDNINKWDGVDRKSIEGQINSLRLYEWMFDFLQNNRALILRSAFAGSMVISLPFYLYISYLFASVYFGIGKMAHLSYPFSTALLHSMYMPFAWTALPSNFAIGLLGGVQAILVSAMGYTIFMRHLGNRFERIISATERICRPLQEESFKNKRVQIQVTLASRPPATTSGKSNQSKAKQKSKRG